MSVLAGGATTGDWPVSLAPTVASDLVPEKSSVDRDARRG